MRSTALPASPPQPLITSPILPVYNTQSPEPISPPFPAKAFESAPALPATASVTTAQDILANVLHRSPPKGLPRPVHTRQASAPQTQVLFGSNALGTGPSIWSSSANESAAFNLHNPVSTASAPSYQAPYPQSHLPSLSPSFPMQLPLGLGHPSVPPSHQYNPTTFAANHSHQRVHSMSASRSQHITSSQTQSPHSSQFSEAFGSYPVLTEQAPITFNGDIPGTYANSMYTRKLDSSYPSQDPSGMVDRSVPYHIDLRRSSGHREQFPPLPSRAQLWNNVG